MAVLCEDWERRTAAGSVYPAPPWDPAERGTDLTHSRAPRLLATIAAAALAVGALAGYTRAADLEPVAPHADQIPCLAEQEPNDQPEQAPIVAGEVCLTGTLPELRGQDLALWDVPPAEALVTWRFTMEGIPTTITSVWVYEIDSPDGVYPLDTTELFRVDSDATSATPGVKEGVALHAGRYLLAIARGAPADNSEPPPAEYRLTVEHEQALPPNLDTAPNDDATTAVATPGATFALTGALQGDPDTYRWTLSAADAAKRWQIDLRGVQAGQIDLALQGTDGTALASTRTQSDDMGHLYDLQLPAGTYDIALSTSSGDPLGYLLSAAPSDAKGWDPEPNDAPEQALPATIGVAMTGRLAGPRDLDQYAITIPADPAGHQFDVGVTASVEADREVCLTRLADGDQLCHRGTGDVTLSNLLLEPGDYLAVVDGDEELTGGYTFLVSDVGPVRPDREVEPNDTTETATTWDPTVVMHGRSANGDVDHYRVPIAGDPQVWRLDASGSGIRSLTWIQADGTIRGTADISADGTRASLWDMVLIPGDTWLAVETRGEDYTLTLTPLGPHADGAEREPNNDAANAEPIAMGDTRTGRLPGPADADVFSFSTGAPEHVTVRLDPPADAAIKVAIASGTEDVSRVRQPTAGEPFAETLELQPGDYVISLQSDSGSTQPYTLQLTREDPFGQVADLEPNDVQGLARPMPATLHVDGSGYGAVGEDHDWYVLPPLTAEAPVTFTVSPGAVIQELRDATSSVRLDSDASGLAWTTGPLPAGTQLWVSVGATGPYTLDVASDGLSAPGAATALGVTAQLDLAATEVAAYTEFGQRVTGTLHLAGALDGDRNLTIDWATSHPDWTVDPSQTAVDIPAGSSADVPFDLVVPRDAWADVPVQVTLRARDDTGRQVTAAVDVTPRRDAPLVSPEAWWPVPTALLGGLDVASTALGATGSGPGGQEMLHDGAAMTGIGFSGRLNPDSPLVFTVDLAGDDPIPVAGMIIDPLSQNPALSTSPRDVELLLSQDGTTWEPALNVELTTRQEDQAFALPSAIAARYAQLIVRSTYGGPDSYANLGEWQVIASPEWQPPAAFDVADPSLGGHVAWMHPGPTDPSQPESMLTNAAESRWAPWVTGQSTIDFAIGFQDDRAARITQLEWVDPPSSDPATRFPSVGVSVSSGSALGPWVDLGTWSLDRAADGSVAPFMLPRPTWARFVRITGAGPAETGYWELPTTIRVLEQPVGADDRSILGAWGRNDATASYEQLVPPDPSSLELAFDLTDGNDTPDTATPLSAGEPVQARIRRGQDIDWYSLTVPATDNILDLSVQARPDAGLVVTAEDATGAPLDLVSKLSATPGELVYEADVTPGATYRVRVEQAPVSTVFTYDTSGSMGAYLSYVTAALRGFASDVIPGEEAVKVMPFGDRPLVDHWSDDPYEIASSIASAFGTSGTSAAEQSIAAAAKELATRPGARAMLVVTDAETSSYPDGSDMWYELDQVRPIIFTIHVAGGDYPALTTELMQDWAASWGGRYEYASSHAQIDRAFDRLATWLRRPAAYQIQFGSRFVSHAPGTLAVLSTGGSGSAGMVAGSGVAVEILLDTSGSMMSKTQGGRRIDVAKDVLTHLINDTLSPGIPTALRIFTPGKDACSSKIVAPMAPLDPAAMTDIVHRLKIKKGTKTPIAATLREVAGDVSSVNGLRIIVLITDGRESCKGDPAAVIQELVDSGLDVRVNIVGFDIDNAGLKEQIAQWAALGNGQSFDASGADGLRASIAAALAAPFRVIDKDGNVVGTGVVGGDPVPLPPGTYRVEILTDPIIVREGVEVAADTNVRLEVAPPDPGASPAP